MVKRFRWGTVAVLIALILGLGGCGPKQQVDTPLAAQPEPAPMQEEPQEEPWGSSESGGQTNATAFKGTDFLTGEEVKFEPGESSRPAIISFFSLG